MPHSSASTQVKPPNGTQQVWQVAKWLETETLRFNETFSERQLSSPALEFLLLATKSARQLHSKAFYELTKQVMQTGCKCWCTCALQQYPIRHVDKQQKQRHICQVTSFV